GFGDGESRVQGSLYGRLAAKYALALFLFVAGFFKSLAWWLLGLGLIFFVVGQARRGTGKIGTLERLFLIPLLKITYDMAYLSGYVKGRLTPPVRPLPDPGSPPAAG